MFVFGKRFDISLYQFHNLQFHSQKLTFRQYFYIFTFLNHQLKLDYSREQFRKRYYKSTIKRQHINNY